MTNRLGSGGNYSRSAGLMEAKMTTKRSFWVFVAAAGTLACGVCLTQPEPVLAAEPDVEGQLAVMKTFDALFMEQVKIGDSLFHGDKALEQKMKINLSSTGMACAMCHPFAADTHPAQYPKWQEQMSKFAALRDMINWCIEKPNQGEAIDVDGPAMKALEAYITWSNKNSPLAAGTH